MLLGNNKHPLKTKSNQTGVKICFLDIILLSEDFFVSPRELQPFTGKDRIILDNASSAVK